MEEAAQTARVDQWLWAVRVFKTRGDANEACRGGRVRVNDKPAKPATTVHAGDRVEARTERGQRIVEVVRVIAKRVGPPVAASCFVDHSPPPPPEADLVFRRDRGAGRPTKRDRRQLDRLRGRSS